MTDPQTNGVIKNKVRFSLDDAQKAGDDWRFNCGPGALCAVLNMTPDELRPHMLDFEKKGYTNPTLMTDVLTKLRVGYRQTYRSDNPVGMPLVKFGLVRIQWGGPWTKPGVPMRVRYRHTHWVAAANDSKEIFDINAMCIGGWIRATKWALELTPWLMKECCPKNDGSFWPTHVLELPTL